MYTDEAIKNKYALKVFHKVPEDMVVFSASLRQPEFFTVRIIYRTVVSSYIVQVSVHNVSMSILIKYQLMCLYCRD